MAGLEPAGAVSLTVAAPPRLSGFEDFASASTAAARTTARVERRSRLRVRSTPRPAALLAEAEGQEVRRVLVASRRRLPRWHPKTLDTVAVKSVRISFDCRKRDCDNVGRVAKILATNMTWLTGMAPQAEVSRSRLSGD